MIHKTTSIRCWRWESSMTLVMRKQLKLAWCIELPYVYTVIIKRVLILEYLLISFQYYLISLSSFHAFMYHIYYSLFYFSISLSGCWVSQNYFSNYIINLYYSITKPKGVLSKKNQKEWFKLNASVSRS